MSSPPPLAGRRSELQALLDAVATAEPGPGVLIAGEAGIGKSRLVTALGDILGTRDTALAVGCCLRLSQDLPFLPVIDVLRVLPDAGGEPVLTTAIDRCPPFVRSELARLLPELARDPVQLPTVDADPMQRQRLFDAIRRVLQAVRSIRRTVVVIEDVHWADGSTLDLCDYLLTPGHLTGVPIVFTGRADEVDDHWLTSTVVRRRLPRVDLRALSREETAAQIAGLLDRPVDPEHVDVVYRRTGGHAFYTEQLVAAPPELLATAIPAGLRSVLLTRVSQVSADGCHLLAVLAVADRPLDEAVLAAVTEWGVQRTREALRVLVADALVSPVDDRYRLRHVLLGDAVAGDLLPGELRAVHLAIARVLAAQDSPMLAAGIAAHFAAAGDDAEELRWRTRAARYASRLLAASDASVQWLRVIDLYDRTPNAHTLTGQTASEVYLEASWAYEHTGDDEHAADLAERALASLEPDAPDAQRARTCRVVGHWRTVASPEAGEAMLRRAVDLYEPSPPSRDKALTLHRLFQALLRRRAHLDAEQRELIARALRVATEAGSAGAQRMLRGASASVRMFAGDRAGAVRLAERAAATRRDVSDPHTTIGAAIYVTEVLLKCGEYARAAETGAEELRWIEENGYPTAAVSVRLRSNVVQALREQGRVADARALLDAQAGRQPPESADLELAHLACLDGTAIPAAVDVRWQYEQEMRRSVALFDREYVSLGVEIRLWAGAAHAAADDALRALESVAVTEVSRFVGGMFALAMRACADLADRARQGDDTADLQTAGSLADRVVGVAARCLRDPFIGPLPATAPGDGRLWLAEQSRLHGRSDPDLWDAAASSWLDLGLVHRAGYARYRQAEALLASPTGRGAAGAILRSAAALTDQHAPLTRAVQVLASRARITLTTGPAAGEPTTTDPPSAPFGLTERELAVLRQIGAGRTNAQIGQALYISSSTAGVHVSNILRKLNVTSRVQAAAVASTLGLLETGSEPRANHVSNSTVRGH